MSPTRVGSVDIDELSAITRLVITIPNATLAVPISEAIGCVTAKTPSPVIIPILPSKLAKTRRSARPSSGNDPVWTAISPAAA
jgi:hypothetical protein